MILTRLFASLLATSLALAPLTTTADPYVIKGSCKLVVDGTTYVDMRGGSCPIWMEKDGTGRFWINTDRDGYLGDYFAEVSPAGDGTAQAHWNGTPGATHAQGYLGDDLTMGSGGCWTGKRVTVCAAR
ncbi:MAG: hypothetical protein VX874_20005 [Pseudomonadota bacterium]|nr:hypothetical protein [Pseudomonadota bacterium]